MKIKFSLCLMLMLSLFIVRASAQNVSLDRVKPQWLHKLPVESNTSFKYEIVSANATSMEAAREKCLTELISSYGLSNGVVVMSEYKSNEKLSQVWKNGKLTETVDYKSNTITSTKSKESEIFVEKIDEYWTRDDSGIYYLTTLYARSVLGIAPLFDNVELTTKYGGHGLWRSAIVPGWGQFYKGSNLKGGLILGGSVAFAVGIIFTENQRVDYANKILKTHEVSHKRAYASRRDNFAVGRNICIGGLAALYVYNLVDAIVAPGARRVVVNHNRRGRSYAIAPTVMYNGNPGLAAVITF